MGRRENPRPPPRGHGAPGIGSLRGRSGSPLELVGKNRGLGRPLCCPRPGGVDNIRSNRIGVERTGPVKGGVDVEIGVDIKIGINVGSRVGNLGFDGNYVEKRKNSNNIGILKAKKIARPRSNVKKGQQNRREKNRREKNRRDPSGRRKLKGNPRDLFGRYSALD